MDTPPPAQPAAAPPPAAPSSSTSASALSSAPQPYPTPSASTASQPTSNSTLAPTPTPTAAPVQTLETSAPSPASARPPAPRMRPPYTHLASPITMSSSPATAASSSSSASAPAASSASSVLPRGAVALGLPAHPRGPQTPVGYTGFVPPTTLAAQFSGSHRGPDQPSPSSTQVRPGAITGLPQQTRPSFPSSTAPSPFDSQMPSSQKTPIHALARPPSMASPSPSMALQQTPSNVSAPLRPPQQRPHVTQQRAYHAPVISQPQNLLLAQQQQQKVSQQQHLQQQQQSQPQHSLQQNQQTTTLRNQQQISQQQAGRNPVPMAQKLDSPAKLQTTNTQSVDMASVNVAGGSGNRLLSKRSIHELVSQIDPSEKLDPEVEDVLIDIAEDFVESVATFACSLAKHRKSSTLEAKDVLLHAERSWNITLPGFSGDEIKLYKKPHVNDIHRERLTLVLTLPILCVGNVMFRNVLF
ncbi:hypothetical protein GUJ93_ZPchr0007g5982 [Zizania palustris]|uniref:Transcription initiation factor TFIID subunit 12 domain-containing protein n=1 Tax=Zizania palustris TaxID=103762 RepID=A0A8J5TET7_ZIZPA|nr:hypothetical protein GUJ93_ZPchr0007g5982 [Zizania palustris]